MKKAMLLFVGAALCGLTACDQSASTTKSDSGDNSKSADMKARYKLINDAFSTGNTAAIDTLLGPNAEDHSAPPGSKYPKGAAGLKQMIADMRVQTPDLKGEMKYVATDGDILIAYGTMSGTNTGSLPGMPATNKKWSADFSDVIKFGSDMKMTEHWGVWDEAKMMRDMGLIPPMGEAPKDTTRKN